MDWIDTLDVELRSLEGRRPKAKDSRSDLTRDLSVVYLNVMVRFALNTDAEMKMLPNQWDIATYHGDRKWDIKKNTDFELIDELIIADDRPHGSAMMTEFFSKKGFENVRSGFLIPETIGGQKRCTFFVANASTIQKASVSKIWKDLRKGVEMWYESVLRDDIAPFKEFCEKSYQVESAPAIPDNL
ncbi:MAG: hypothetical protein LUQ55_03990 [Methanomassiliicoccales archaeon]|nr:hypothetical protein [Methanomassiliicoccales archaeon]